MKNIVKRAQIAFLTATLLINAGFFGFVPLAHAAWGNISASPSFFDGSSSPGPFTSYISWDSGGFDEVSGATVYVAVDGGEETLFSYQNSCSGCAADWIYPGEFERHYEFRLYEYNSFTGWVGQRLDSVTVVVSPQAPAGGVPRGDIFAGPNPCTVPSGASACTSYITWQTQNVSGARVYLETDGIYETLFAEATSCSGTACPTAEGGQPWIQPGHTYAFKLYDYSNFARGALLNQVTVTATGGGGPTCPQAATLAVTPDSASGAVNQVFSFVANYDPDGPSCPQASQNVTSASSWSSNNSGVAASLGSGQFRGVGAGTATVTASYLGLTGAATLSVTGAAQNPTFAITPSSASVAVNETANFTAWYDPDGSGSQAQQNVTSASSWWADNAAVAVSVGSGAFRGAGAGTTAVHASYLGLTANANLTVSGASFNPVLSINKTSFLVNEVWTLNLSGAPANQQVYICGRKDSGQNTCTPAQNLSLPSTTSANGTWSASGGFNNSHIGSWVEWAYVGGTIVAEGVVSGGVRSNDISFTVSAAGGASTLVVNPSSASVQVNQTVGFTALYDPDGPSGSQPQQNVTAASSWTSSNPSIASLQGNGQFMGVSAGSVTVTASYLGLSATASLTVSGVSGGAPFVSVSPATGVTETAAVLNGQVNPNGSATTYRFEYGTNPAALTLSTTNQSVGSGTTFQNVSASLSGLTSNTTYYFRLTAQNSFGSAASPIASFTTQMGGGCQPGTTPTPTLTISPPSASVAVNQTVAFTATYDPDGPNCPQAPQTVTTIATWTSQSPSVAASLGNGVFQGASAGTAAITASYLGSTVNAVLTVSGGGNPTLVISPSSGSVSVGQTTSFAAMYDPDGPTGSQPQQNVTALASWSSGNTSIATSLGNGVFQGVSAGTTGLTALYLGSTATAGLTVTGGGNPTLTVTPPSQSVNVGQTVSYAATFDPDGPTGSQPAQNVTASATWTSQNTVIASSLGAGVFRGESAGTTSVTANFSGLSVSASITVTGTTACNVAPFATTESATNVTQNSATLNGQADPNNCATSYRFEYGTSPSSLSFTTSFQSAGSGDSNVSASAVVSGLSSNTTYFYRIMAQSSAGSVSGSILSFTTSFVSSGNAPTAVTNPATNIGQNSATLNGLVNPQGLSTTYRFEYGTNPNSLNLSTGSFSVGSATGDQSVFQTVSGLSSNTTYYFRIVATNSAGTATGAVLSFSTSFGGGGGCTNCIPPTVQTTAASGISQNSANLNGLVNPNGSQTSYYFEYGQTVGLGNTTGFQNAGSGVGNINATSFISGLNPNATYYFRIVATNSFGTVQGAILSFVTGTSGGGFQGAPTVTTGAATSIGQNTATLNGQVNPQGSDTQAWFEYGVNPTLLTFTTSFSNVGSGTSFFNFSQQATNLSLNTTYYFRAVARNNFGFAYGQVLSFVTSGTGGAVGLAPAAVTRPATFTFQNSALLNGDVNPQGGITSAWFEYGPTLSLGLKSPVLPVGSGSTFSAFSSAVSGLLSNTTYYFRIAAQNQYGTSFGSILSFRTTGVTVVTPTVTTPPAPRVITQTATSTAVGVSVSCVALVPTLSVTELSAGQEFTYSVVYRNGCNFPLRNASLKVVLPVEVDFLSTSYPVFTREGNTVFFNLGTVSEGVELAVNIRGRVKNNVEKGDNLIFTAILTFSDRNGGFNSITAYLTAVITTGGGPTLGASITEAFRGLLGSWIFWLLLILLLILLIYLIFFRRREREEQVDLSGLRVSG